MFGCDCCETLFRIISSPFCYKNMILKLHFKSSSDVGCVDFIILFRYIPVNKLILVTKIGINRDVFMKSRKLSDYDFSI